MNKPSGSNVIRLRYLLAFGLLASLLISGQVATSIAANQLSPEEFMRGFRSTDDDGVLTPVEVLHIYRYMTTPKLEQLSSITLGLLIAGALVLVAEALFIFEPLIGTVRRQFKDLSRQNHDLEAARDEAQAASRIKSEFLANMSHEIRTPMNGVLGLTELMLQTQVDSQQREYLTLIRQSAKSLLTLLNDILDLSKIEAGRLDLETTQFDLSQCVESAVRLLGLAASEKGVRLDQRLAPGLSPTLLGDPNRLRQVLVNLIGNAVKFTARGEVVVSARQVWRRDLATELHFSVRDTGIGIPPDKLGLVFEAFRQADSSTSRRFGGTGLGLSICQQLVQMMGGRIWAESEVGRGSTFHFTVTLGIPQRPARSELAPHPALVDAPVLVAADDPAQQQVLAEALKQLSLCPANSEHRAVAAELDRAAESGRPYRLIVANQAVLSAEAGAPQSDFGHAPPPILVTVPCPRGQAESHTGAGPGGAASPSASAQADWQLSEPIEPWLLLQAIETVLGIGGPASASATPPSAPPPTAPPPDGQNERAVTRQVLLVEDGLINQTVAVGLLKRRGHAVVVANHGAEALEALARQPFDVVLMDVQMPVMDGLEAARAIREQEASTGRHQRIVAMSAGATSEERDACAAAGMDDFLMKPVDPLELYHLVESVPALAAPAIANS
jgi:signal transduction histidine kinase/CheY-like chemotaxis protein